MELNENVKLPFPPEDYDKKGKLKKVRGRMLRKLLKTELKCFLPIYPILMGVMVLCACFLRLETFIARQNSPEAMIFSVNSIVFYILAVVGGFAYAAIQPINRYNKNFFQGEGYLTFSIPASMEEHVLAKRLSAIIGVLGMSLTAIISLLIAFGGEVFDGLFAVDFSGERIHAIFFTIEEGLQAFLGAIALQTVAGVGTCLSSKMSTKRKNLWSIVVVFLCVGLFNTALISSELWFPLTYTAMHVQAWVSILLLATVCVGGFFFELWFLKNKLDLK